MFFRDTVMISGVEVVSCGADQCGVRVDALLIPKIAMATSIFMVTRTATVEPLPLALTNSLNVLRSKSYYIFVIFVILII